MGWVFRQGKKLTILTLPEWQREGIQIGFSTRWGGVGKFPYESLNLGLHVGDHPETVRENRRRWLQEWDATWKDVVVGEQVHGTNVYWVEDKDAGRGSLDLNSVIPGVDGLLTGSSLGLMAFFADCISVYFYHPILKAVGLAHAGWRGTVGKIVQEVLKELAKRGGNPQDCWVALGPGIGSCCYEVDAKVIQPFHETFVQNSVLKPIRPGHAQLDLREANRLLLIEAGVRPENIWSTNLCTACHTDTFFSHRREGPQTGRMAGWIRLVKEESVDDENPRR